MKYQTRIKVVEDGFSKKYYPQYRTPWLPVWRYFIDDLAHDDRLYYLSEKGAKKSIDDFLDYKRLKQEHKEKCKIKSVTYIKYP